MLARINLGVAVVMAGVVFLALVVDRERAASLPEPTGERAPAGLSAFYDQEVAWTNCRGGLCGTVKVPLSYDDPGGRTVELNVKLRPADERPTRRMLFVNPGGPGGSAFEYANGFAGEVKRAVRRDLGIVGVDPRGVGTSEAIECLTPGQLDRFLDVDATPDSAAEQKELRSAFRDLGEACVEHSGELMEHMSTEEAARDLDVVRAVLGQRELDYYGASYGTQIGATYAHLFPEHAGRMVLDGGVDPGLSARKHAMEQAEAFEAALQRFLEYCTKLETCPLGDDVDAAEQRVIDVLEEADREPLESQGGIRPATEASALRGIAFALYEEDRWPLLVRSLDRASFGEGTGLRQLSDKYDQRDDRGYDNNSTVAYHAVRCLDLPRSPDFDDVGGFEDDFTDAAPVFGRNLAWSAAACSAWPVEPTSPQGSVEAEGVDSIVVIGTTNDPATPYAWSERLAEALGDARLMTREGDGHTAYLTGNRCVDELVDDHLLGRALPRGELRCDADGRMLP